MPTYLLALFMSTSSAIISVHVLMFHVFLGDGEANLDLPGDQLQWNALKFLMNIKESCNISETATSKIVLGTQDLFDSKLREKKVCIWAWYSRGNRVAKSNVVRK